MTTDRSRHGSGEDLASFGFREVPIAEKPRLVKGVFETVASRYDVMNDVMSLGVHRLWKDAMVSWLNPRPGVRLLDVAGGTGDIARRVLARVKGQGSAIVCDMTDDMLVAGRARGEAEGISWVCGDAQALPLPDACMDAYTIAFGIRNVARIDLALAEARRVLRPGGRFMCLEFSHVVVPGLDALYDAWSFHMIPRMGGWVAGEREPYQYLVESIRRFPTQERFAEMIADAGFSRVKVRNLSGGIAALHSAWAL
ncbi:class I SAM-dependent methyltransferase [Futiania mangrovi]|uniref:Ubiquinone/menaquinone biosynthesis C-methyltransferase UbiE n=1 Tax=Futiania mangrovi TaxID=2959716 RepID=A0A9J6PCZ4_9PROT|nr:class I SAM-dependent methyltransferase [Futiania mangrovii]MCP1336449.1 class I SAM-dependent methyltransferase [Futiania mangrovii]